VIQRRACSQSMHLPGLLDLQLNSFFSLF
jgi:hypothetical protein